MSPLWSERSLLGCTRILVTANQLLAEVMPAGLSAKQTLHSLAWTGSDAIALRSALQQLLHMLGAAAAPRLPRRCQRIELYLADPQVHVLKLPAMPADLFARDWRGQDQTAYARAMLLQTYGEQARDWPLRLQDSGQPQDGLLATLPLCTGIDWQALFSPYALHWTVQPWVTAVWARTALPATGTVLSAEPHMLRLMHRQQGRLVHVAATPLTVDQPSQLMAWLQRERLLAAADHTPCYWLQYPGVHASQTLGVSLKAQAVPHLSWQTLPLSGLPCSVRLLSLAMEAPHVATA